MTLRIDPGRAGFSLPASGTAPDGRLKTALPGAVENTYAMVVRVVHGER
jgi:hypothetical protein